MTQDVDTRLVSLAGDAYGQVYDGAAAAVHTLAGVLKGSAGMAGTDNGAHAWASKYDPLCGGRAGGAGLMEAAIASITGAAQCADLLHTTAINHQNADRQSAINNSTAPAFPPGAKPTFVVPAIPSAEGGHSDVPGWWHTIEAYVEGEVWPNGHQDQLNAAAAAWHTAANGLRTAADIANGFVIGAVRTQKSPEFPAAADCCQKDRDSLNSVADGFDAAGKACSDYAHAIDQAHSQILQEMAWLGGTVVVTEVVAAVLIPFTLGGSEAVSKVVDVARLTATGLGSPRYAAPFAPPPRRAAFLRSARLVQQRGPSASSVRCSPRARNCLLPSPPLACLALKALTSCPGPTCGWEPATQSSTRPPKRPTENTSSAPPTETC